MPVADNAVHVRVLDDLRSLFGHLLSSSYAESGSAAFQLGATIKNVQSVISELSGDGNALES